MGNKPTNYDILQDAKIKKLAAGVVTSITAGTGIYVDQAVGAVTVSNTLTTASDIANTPTAPITKFNVQEALDEAVSLIVAENTWNRSEGSGGDGTLTPTVPGDEVNMVLAKIVNLGDPTADTDADTKGARNTAIANIPQQFDEVSEVVVETQYMDTAWVDPATDNMLCTLNRPSARDSGDVVFTKIRALNSETITFMAWQLDVERLTGIQAGTIRIWGPYQPAGVEWEVLSGADATVSLELYKNGGTVIAATTPLAIGAGIGFDAIFTLTIPTDIVIVPTDEITLSWVVASAGTSSVRAKWDPQPIDGEDAVFTGITYTRMYDSLQPSADEVIEATEVRTPRIDTYNVFLGAPQAGFSSITAVGELRISTINDARNPSDIKGRLWLESTGDIIIPHSTRMSFMADQPCYPQTGLGLGPGYVAINDYVSPSGQITFGASETVGFKVFMDGTVTNGFLSVIKSGGSAYTGKFASETLYLGSTPSSISITGDSTQFTFLGRTSGGYTVPDITWFSIKSVSASTTALLPLVNAMYDLGTASYAYRHLYLSGNIYATGSVATHTQMRSTNKLWDVTIDDNGVLTSADITPTVITMTSPVGGEEWVVGESRAITWTSVGNFTKVDIDLALNGNDPSPTFDQVVVSNVSNTPYSGGTYTATIDADWIAANCKVRVKQYGASANGVSPAIFAIEDSLTLTLTYPIGGEVLTVGDPLTITWDKFGDVGNVDIGLSTDSGGTYPIAIATNVANTGSYVVVGGVPSNISSTCRVRVKQNVGALESSSGSDVTIQGPQPVSDGLGGWWKLDETVAGAVIDERGLHDGVNQGATINETGFIGQSYLFANNQNVKISELGADTRLRDSGGLTLEAWIKWDDYRAGHSPIIHRWLENPYYFFSVNSGKLTFLKNDGGVIAADSNLTVNTDVWVYVAFTFTSNAGTCTFYLGDDAGNLTSENVSLAGALKVQDPLNGCSVCLGYQGSGNYFVGWIDEARVYNKALSLAEIQQNYALR